MRLPIRAAALSAAALTLFGAAGLSAPSVASEFDAAPATSHLEHAGVALHGADLGLNFPDETLPDIAADAPSAASVLTHSSAPALPAPTPVQEAAPADERAGRSLSQLVGDYASADPADSETDCLARAVYYESKGEPLAGQLTVAEVILNRSRSGRFPSTICGVVRQAGQFSFVRRGAIPTPPRGSNDWRTAVAIAQIATRDLAEGSAPRALFFHARHVSPGWRLTRVATVGNHVFYR